MAVRPRQTVGAGKRRLSGLVGLAALSASAALLAWAGRGLTFFSDDWSIIQSRLDWNVDAFLKPHNEHLMAFPVLVFKPLLATVGLEHHWPYRLTVIVAHLVCLVLLFTIARRRHGSVVAAAAVMPLLAFGAAWEVTLWPINIGFLGSVVAALGTVLCLDRGDRRGDIAAGALLILALASSGLGVPLALGVLVEVMWDGRRWRRVWVAAVPLALYAAWYVVYNRHPARQGPLEYAEAPWYALRTASAAVGGYFGVGIWTPDKLPAGIVRPAVGVLTAALFAVTVWLLLRRGRLTARVAMIAVTLGSYWILLSVSRAFLGQPYTSRRSFAPTSSRPGAWPMPSLCAPMRRSQRPTPALRESSSTRLAPGLAGSTSRPRRRRQLGRDLAWRSRPIRVSCVRM